MKVAGEIKNFCFYNYWQDARERKRVKIKNPKQ